MTLPTPPRYVVLPYEIMEQAYAPDKPRRALFSSFARILALAWETKYEKTPRLNEEELMAFLKLSRRQYFEQKADMELLQWLRSSHPVPGFVQFNFSRSIVASVSSQPQTAEISSAINRTVRAENTENRTDPSLIVVGESLIKDLNTDSTPPTLNAETSAKNRTSRFPTAVEILAQTPLLFDGAVVISKGLENREALDVLCWCAYAYSQKGKMTAPGGVVRNRLLENQRPIEWTKHKWQETLPEDFLEVLGLIKYECDVCREIFEHRADLDTHKKSHPAFAICEICSLKFETREQLDEHWENAHPEPKYLEADQSVAIPILGGMTAEQAWRVVLDQLQSEMPRASFETWVRDAQAVRYDRNVLTVAVKNRYAADWITNRLAATIMRILVGVLHEGVEVEFVVADFSEVESES